MRFNPLARFGKKNAAHSETRSPWLLTWSAWAVVIFLHFPVAVILLYAFTTDAATYTFPLPGFTARWFAVAWGRADLWAALWLSVRVALISTLLALLLGTLAAAAVVRSKFYGRDAISFLLLLPIALPGIITGIALRSALGLAEIPFSFWTIVLGHATFCIVVVYNNVVARFRRTAWSLVEASMDLGANGFQTFRYVVLPQIATALHGRRHVGLRPLLRRSDRHHLHRRAAVHPAHLDLQPTRPSPGSPRHQRGGRLRHRPHHHPHPPGLSPHPGGQFGQQRIVGNKEAGLIKPGFLHHGFVCLFQRLYFVNAAASSPR